MDFYGAKELAASFRTVRKNTLAIANDVSEESYGFRVTPETRTIGQTLVHIAIAPKMQLQIHQAEHLTSLAKFDFMGFMAPIMAAEKIAMTKAEIVTMLETSGHQFAQWLESLSDDFLAEQVEYPQGMTPPTKSRFEMILGVKEHEMHHRGQLMVMQRLVGIVPHMTREMQARIAAMTAKA